MQVTETLNEGLKRGYQITVSAQELDEKVTAKLREAQPDVQLKGFRKGKVPLTMLRKQFGRQVMGEAMQESIDGAMREHFETTGDRPALQPEIRMTNDDWKEGQDIEVAVSYECLPEMPDLDFKAISLERLVVKADEAAVTEALENLAKNAGSFEDRGDGEAAQDGDQVVIDFVGRIDGEAFEGGAAEDYPLTLGSDSFIPGFEAQLVGVVAGEEKAVTVSFPADYGAAHLAGKEAVFDVTVKAVKAPAAAALDDEMAKSYGADSLEALKAQVVERLEAEYAGAARQLVKRRLLDALDEVLSIELPESLTEAEARQIAHQLWHEDRPEVEGHDHEDPEITDEHRKLAKRRVGLGLLLAELGRKHEIQVSDSEFTQAVMNAARQYPGQERQFFEFVQQNAEVQTQIRAPLFEDKVVDFILELADVTEKPVDKDALKEALDALDAEE
ncbi:MAG: trigger factor [Rhodobacteraceae bacterium]|nr:trigger factor [Paracoccaceae bacterium]